MANGGTASSQALSQGLAIIVTLGFALVGGLVTGRQADHITHLTLLCLGLLMLMVGKMERMEGEDFYNDDWNIDELEAKEELPEELKGLMDDWNNKKTKGNNVSFLCIRLLLF